MTAADLLVLAPWLIFGAALAAICYRLLVLYFPGGWGVWLDYNVATENDYTMWTVPGIYWQIGGAFVIAVIAILAGVACYIYCRITRPAFFMKQTLTRATPTLTPDK